MEDYQFYKSKFDRELSRRNDLDNAINNPILGITIIFGLTSYILTNHNFLCWYIFDFIILGILILSVITILSSLVCVFISINNLFTGFNYPNFGSLKGYRKFQKDLEEYNKSQENESNRKDFETEIVEKIIDFADINTEINDKRALYLHYSRKYIVIAFILTFLNLVLITINNL
jgi:hypothetical protein